MRLLFIAVVLSAAECSKSAMSTTQLRDAQAPDASAGDTRWIDDYLHLP